MNTRDLKSSFTELSVVEQENLIADIRQQRREVKKQAILNKSVSKRKVAAKPKPISKLTDAEKLKLLEELKELMKDDSTKDD